MGLDAVCADRVKRYFGLCRRYEMAFRLEAVNSSNVDKVVKLYSSHRRVLDKARSNVVLKMSELGLKEDALKDFCFCFECESKRTGTECHSVCTMSRCPEHGSVVGDDASVPSRLETHRKMSEKSESETTREEEVKEKGVEAKDKEKEEIQETGEDAKEKEKEEIQETGEDATEKTHEVQPELREKPKATKSKKGTKKKQKAVAEKKDRLANEKEKEAHEPVQELRRGTRTRKPKLFRSVSSYKSEIEDKAVFDDSEDAAPDEREDDEKETEEDVTFLECRIPGCHKMRRVALDWYSAFKQQSEVVFECDLGLTNSPCTAPCEWCKAEPDQCTCPSCGVVKAQCTCTCEGCTAVERQTQAQSAFVGTTMVLKVT